MKRFIVLSILIITLLCSLVVFTSCGVEDETIEYNNVMASRYADSFEILSTNAAPSQAVEYKNEERVEKRVLIDTRIVGLHTLGLYLPKNETITISIPAEFIEVGLAVTVNKNLTNEQTFKIENEYTEIVSEYGGILELDCPYFTNDSNCLSMVIKGAMAASYYRYTIDGYEELRQVGKYVTLDATNVRFYFDVEHLKLLDDAASVMMFWQSAVAFMDEALNLSFYNFDYSPLKIYMVDDTYLYNVDENVVYLPISTLNTILSSKKLMTGDDTKLLDVLKQICMHKVHKSELYDDAHVIKSVNEILSSYTYAKMVDSKSASDMDTNYILNEAICLEKAINKNYDDEQKNTSLLMILYYEFGPQAIVDVFKNSLTNIHDIASFVYEVSFNQQKNTLELMQLYEIKDQLSEEQIEQLNQFSPLYLVANKFAHGVVKNDIQPGLHFKYGKKETIDFAKEIVAVDPNWKIEKVEGSGWSKINENEYAYTPSADILKDTFVIMLENGDKKKSLIGNLTVDIDVSSYSLYSNIKYDAASQDKLSDAIKQSSSLTPNKIDALYEAIVPKENEIDTSLYSLAVTTGCMQVDHDAKYEFYLTSSGLCKVVFGVADHNFVMFDNILTVGDYTEELKYEIALQSGYKYYYTIYVLSNKGSGYANLGIKEAGTSKIKLIDRDYLICNNKKLTRDNIVKFNPNTDIRIFKKQESQDHRFEIKPVVNFTENLYVEETNHVFKITSTEQMQDTAHMVLTLRNPSKTSYFKIKTEDMLGVTLKLTTGTDFKDVLIEKELQGGEERIEFNYPSEIQEIKVELTKSGYFDVNILRMEIGDKLKEMDIVGSSSTEIEYIGEWSTSHKYIGMNNSVTMSKSKISSISYKFNGDEIAVYAVKDKGFGRAKVYIDGTEKAIIDFYSDNTMCAQLMYTTKLEAGDHVIEIKALGDAPITLDYFAVSKTGDTKIKNDFSKLWYVIFIPALIIIAGIICIYLDIKEKKKNKNSKISIDENSPENNSNS